MKRWRRRCVIINGGHGVDSLYFYCMCCIARTLITASSIITASSNLAILYPRASHFCVGLSRRRHAKKLQTEQLCGIDFFQGAGFRIPNSSLCVLWRHYLWIKIEFWVQTELTWLSGTSGKFPNSQKDYHQTKGEDLGIFDSDFDRTRWRGLKRSVGTLNPIVEGSKILAVILPVATESQRVFADQRKISLFYFAVV